MCKGGGAPPLGRTFVAAYPTQRGRKLKSRLAPATPPISCLKKFLLESNQENCDNYAAGFYYDY